MAYHDARGPRVAGCAEGYEVGLCERGGVFGDYWEGYV